MVDLGFTHIALPVSNIQESIQYYATYAHLQVVHQRVDAESDTPVAWLSDRTRPFVIVLIQTDSVDVVLAPFAHLGVACKSREEVDALCDRGRREGIAIQGPQDAGHPVGYWAFLCDPDGHTLELSYGQEIHLAVEGDR